MEPYIPSSSSLIMLSASLTRYANHTISLKKTKKPRNLRRSHHVHACKDQVVHSPPLSYLIHTRHTTFCTHDSTRSISCNRCIFVACLFHNSGKPPLEYGLLLLPHPPPPPHSRVCTNVYNIVADIDITAERKRSYFFCAKFLLSAIMLRRQRRRDPIATSASTLLHAVYARPQPTAKSFAMKYFSCL
ncbi:hypothetical protein KP509_35G028600 [Ceratopteris richardii]|uniref:Uncharacterized protein n=1 Tax=Ceratopteris richardii TaxID=49495 RepID=A0A8T2QE89_CERRI|nr:hypothetical protein KP509_35G028600 [Ceratopteris richardii]